MVIDGKAIAAEILERLRALPRPEKFAAGILVGNDAASASFQKIKERTAKTLGIDYRIYRFPSDISSDALRKEVGAIAAHATCGGIIMQLPLPEGVNSQYAQNAIPPEKDPDALSERTLGAFLAGRSKVLQPAAAVVDEIVRRTNFDLARAHVAVVGRGFLVGQPVATWLLRRARSMVVLGRNSDRELLRAADLVILGAGKESLVRAADLKAGAAVIDFGYAAGTDGKLKGDLDPTGGEELLWYTPTPGGTGPVLVAKLFENFYLLNSGR
jgi:methylenetetrahydrofolate dehydrogenase (NADP+) / methenyltetrahydrofolate cyclohydrolase